MYQSFIPPPCFRSQTGLILHKDQKNPQASGEEASAPFRNSLILSNLPVGNDRKVCLTTFYSASLITRINLTLKSTAENSAVIIHVSSIPPE